MPSLDCSGASCCNVHSSDDSYRAVEETPMTQVCRSIFFETHYGRAHFACPVIFLIGMLGLMVSYAVKDGILHNDPSILCVGAIYLKSLAGFGSMSFFYFTDWPWDYVAFGSQ